MVYFDCFIRIGSYTAIITEWSSYYSAVSFKSGRFAVIVPCTRFVVISLFGPLRVSLNYRGQIEGILEAMTNEYMRLCT
jgi:hypothetical protein